MKNSIAIFLICILAGCGSKQQAVQVRTENTQVKALLQGVWTETSDENSPVMQFTDDTVNYINNDIAQQTFKVFNDTLYTYGLQTNAYPIIDVNESKLTLMMPGGETVYLQKKVMSQVEAENFESDYKESPQDITVKEVIKKDKVVTLKGKSYHGYVFINPTSIKVLRPGISDLGLEIENYSFDNIIHICVYQGKNAIYSKDIKKEMFNDIVPPEFLQYSILHDIDFQGVDQDEFLFLANVGIPDNGLSYQVQLRVSQTGEMTFHTNNSN